MRYSTFTLFALITCAQRSTSLRISAANCSGVMNFGVVKPDGWPCAAPGLAPARAAVALGGAAAAGAAQGAAAGAPKGAAACEEAAPEARAAGCLGLVLLSEATAIPGWVSGYREGTIRVVVPMALRAAASMRGNHIVQILQYDPCLAPHQSAVGIDRLHRIHPA